MSVYQELKALLGRDDAGSLTIHIDITGTELVLHFAEKGNNPRGMVMALKIARMDAPGGDDKELAHTLKCMRINVEGLLDTPKVKRHLELLP